MNASEETPMEAKPADTQPTALTFRRYREGERAPKSWRER